MPIPEVAAESGSPLLCAAVVLSVDTVFVVYTNLPFVYSKLAEVETVPRMRESISALVLIPSCSGVPVPPGTPNLIEIF